MTPVEVVRGAGPVILGMPHGGTFLPAEVAARLNARGRELADTDWHIDALYAGLLPGASVVRATFHRYVIDANRPPDGASLYPGQNTTGLIPETDFDGQPIWEAPPAPADAAARRAAFHAPYHAVLAAEIARVRAAHGVAILWDCHSIRSHIPFLFAGRLPDFNIGTADGTSCDARITAAVQDACAGAAGFAQITNGRFKGGWTTRHYGSPAEGVHAIQMEIAQSAYLASEAAPFAFSPERAARIRPVLADALAHLAALAPDLKG
ncbi:MAG: formiminoglutamase [Pseudomonadota bacterium]|jgi:formiminoglutamase